MSQYLFAGDTKPQLDHSDPSYQAALARCYRAQPGEHTVPVDATIPCYGRLTITPREQILPDPPGAQRRAQHARPTRVKASINPPKQIKVRRTIQAQVLEWLIAHGKPASITQVNAGFPDQNRESINAALKLLRAVGEVKSMKIIVPGKQGHFGQWLPADVEWTDYDGGAE